MGAVLWCIVTLPCFHGLLAFRRKQPQTLYFDLLENQFLRILACREAFSGDRLGLQAVVFFLHGGVVIVVAFLSAARDEAVSLRDTHDGHVLSMSEWIMTLRGRMQEPERPACPFGASASIRQCQD